MPSSAADSQGGRTGESPFRFAGPASPADDAFFYHILKPGRYLGREFGIAPRSHGRTVALVYPGPYEAMFADAGWRRVSVQLASTEGIDCVRAFDYGPDLWIKIAETQCAPFAIDGRRDLLTVDEIVFWAADVLAAARIPSVMRKIGRPRHARLGVITSGSWAPRFLIGHADWVASSQGGWLSTSIIELLRGASNVPSDVCDAHDAALWDKYWDGRRPFPEPSTTPQRYTAPVLSKVDIGEDCVDVDLERVNAHGQLECRSQTALVSDAHSGLRASGVDGLRFCTVGDGDAATLAAALTDLGRVFNTRTVRAQWPAVSVDDFNTYWSGIKPHLIKPSFPLLLAHDSAIAGLQNAGHRALNAGWQSLALVMRFASFAEAIALIKPARAIIESWAQSANGFADRRSLRLHFDPAEISDWTDAPDVPGEDDWRGIVAEFRHFREAMSRPASCKRFGLDQIIVRNLLAVSGPKIWEPLALLDLPDREEPETPPFDWLSWYRSQSGMSTVPESRFSCIAPCPKPLPHSEDREETHIADVGESSIESFGRRKRRAALTRRLAAPLRMRMRVRWSKDGSWRLYSHLDMVRIIEQSIRRAGIPAAYSEGFHPRLRVSYGPPLPFGMTSDAEYFDIILNEDCDDSHAAALRDVMPEGISMVEHRAMPTNMPSLSESINEQEFSALLPLDANIAAQLVGAFQAAPQMEWRRPDRPERKPVDPRRSLRKISLEPVAEGIEWVQHVTIGGEGSIRPADWAVLLFGLSPEQLAQTILCRRNLICRRGTQAKSPFEIV